MSLDTRYRPGQECGHEMVLKGINDRSHPFCETMRTRLTGQQLSKIVEAWKRRRRGRSRERMKSVEGPMPVYTVDIACRTTGYDYAALFDALRRSNALSFMENRWLLDVREDVATVTDVLLSYCAAGDRLFVTELTPQTPWTGTGIGDEAKAWLASRMTRVEAKTPTFPTTVTLN